MCKGKLGGEGGGGRSCVDLGMAKWAKNARFEDYHGHMCLNHIIRVTSLPACIPVLIARN